MPNRRRWFAEPGQRFGRLTVLHELPGRAGTGHLAECRCDCGTITTAPLKNLHNGRVTSCGCRWAELQRTLTARVDNSARLAALKRSVEVHGLRHHPLYGTWCSMIYRCENPQARAYQHYGGRGIRVCAEWHDVTTFITWIEANLGPRPNRMTLDRIDNDGNYEPGNVRWATQKEQMANSRPKRPRRAATIIRNA